jgi:hypothetical protein
LAASNNAQRSSGDPRRESWPAARLSSEECKVMSSPVWRTALREAENRRVSPSLAQIAAEVIAPTP